MRSRDWSSAYEGLDEYKGYTFCCEFEKETLCAKIYAERADGYKIRHYGKLKTANKPGVLKAIKSIQKRIDKSQMTTSFSNAKGENK